ncbi:MAG TPA: alpha/beta family hydrolase, partial [Acidimicrobiales bacterium]|nr:alpha/beta family hydrolase [Acidimicrobiales bacterium]
MTPRSPAGLLLFPGAGAGRDAPALVAIDRTLADDLPVVRADFPYRREGRRAPDRAPKLIACVRDEAARLAGEADVDPAAVAL